MRPLLILTALVTICRGKPGGTYNYPVPTPSAPPALLSNLGIPSSLTPSLISLQSPTASVAPQTFLPSPGESQAPSVINFSAPSIAPSLLVQNVIGAGQYGRPLIQPLGLQSFGFQPVVDRSFSLAFPHLQLALPFANQGVGFEQPGFNSGGSLSSIGLPPPQPLPSLPQVSVTPTPPVSFNSAQPFANQGVGFEQLGFNFGGSLSSIGLPQPQPLPSLPQVSVTPTPPVSFSSAQLFGSTVRPTIASPSVEVLGPSIHASEEVEIQKHVYVHVPPEELAAKLPPRRIILPAPRKHYRIIFIKAPTPPEESKAPIVVPQVQDEEKTFVYVLVKKPEEQPEIKIKAAPPRPPTKPEVYFINYDPKKESIEDILSHPELKDEENANIPIIEEKSNDPTVPTVRIGGPSPGPDPQKNVDLNLNKASLTGGSALSLSVTGSPLENTLHVSNTQPPSEDGPPEEH